jgi:hypothetical protein
LSFEIQHISFSFEFIVFIEEKIGILGMDFFEQFDVSLKIAKRILKTKLGKVKIHRYHTICCAKLQVSETITIPARVELTINATIIGNCMSRYIRPYSQIHR